jgi:hypothetical protein
MIGFIDCPSSTSATDGDQGGKSLVNRKERR